MAAKTTFYIKGRYTAFQRFTPDCARVFINVRLLNGGLEANFGLSANVYGVEKAKAAEELFFDSVTEAVNVIIEAENYKIIEPEPDEQGYFGGYSMEFLNIPTCTDIEEAQ